MLRKEALYQAGIPERLRTPDSLRGKRAGNIARISTLIRRPAFKPAEQKSGIEAIARPDRIHWSYRNGGSGKRLSLNPNDGASRSAFDSHARHPPPKFLNRLVHGRLFGHAAGFHLIGQQNVDV